MKKKITLLLSLILILTFSLIPVSCGEQESAQGSITDDDLGLRFIDGQNGNYIVSGLSYDSKEEIVIPSEYNGKPVTKIDNAAFLNKEELRSITIPEGIEMIGESAFKGCISLRDLTIPNSVKNIGSQAFFGCRSISRIYIGKSLETIGADAFQNCTAMLEIYNLSGIDLTLGTKYNGKLAFHARQIYTSLDIESKINLDENGFLFYRDEGKITLIGYTGLDEEIYLPNLGEERYTIGAYAFSNNQKIKKVIFSPSVYEIEKGAFYNSQNMISAKLSENLEIIGDEAFGYCTSLARIVIPNSTQTMGIKSFFGCTKLKWAVVGEKIRDISDSAFAECSELTEVQFSSRSNLRYISQYAFAHCYALEEISLPSYLRYIDKYAFFNAKGLRKIYFKNEIRKIDAFAFHGCKSLDEIHYTGTEEEFNRISFGTTPFPPHIFEIFYESDGKK